MTKKILVAVDLEDDALMVKILRTAGEIAGLHNAPISLVHVEAELPQDVVNHLPADFLERMTGEVREKLGALAEQAGLSVEALHITVRCGTTYQEILGQAEADGADLIIIGGHSPGIADYLLGSNAARVVRRAGCSVYVVR